MSFIVVCVVNKEIILYCHLLSLDFREMGNASIYLLDFNERKSDN